MCPEAVGSGCPTTLGSRHVLFSGGKKYVLVKLLRLTIVEHPNFNEQYIHDY